jgi:hypothetical protein
MVPRHKLEERLTHLSEPDDDNFSFSFHSLLSPCNATL